MSKLTACSECSGFLPPAASACPHCGGRVARSTPLPKPLRAALAIGAGGLLAMTLSACYGGGVDFPRDSGPMCTDNDGDGYCVIDGDCDDANFDIHPFAADPLGDGIDQNCDMVDGVAGDAGP